MSTITMEDEVKNAEHVAGMRLDDAPKSNGLRVKKQRKSATSTPARMASNPNSRASSPAPEDVKMRSASSSTSESPAPKPGRKAAAPKNVPRAPAVLCDQLPDVSEEACKTFQVINDCLYGSRNMGASENDVLDCDCAEDWHDNENHACGEDSDCINRHTKMECPDGDCNCGNGCQNQRFQRKQYADVSVIKTEKKGFGLRANTDLQPNDFVFEYIGEVINEPTFRSRMLKYDKEGIKHFYFMSLTKSEFVDATKKGNLGRFCNHSCDPNCYVDKWVVGQKLRMGIFAGRQIRAGEELVFNYNVDRYGADPQPCYCGEKNCTGFIGGKTQTERATKLPAATIEALGIDDAYDWDTAVAKKARRKKVGEDDEEYVNSFQPRGLEEQDVTKVMAALSQCKEKWIVVKLLRRIQEAEGEHVRHRVVRMHGYQILKTTLNSFKDDDNVVLQILAILWDLPRLTKNKIRDSNIEAAIWPLLKSDHEGVKEEAKKLLDAWDKLTVAYRIPRQKLDPSVPVLTNIFVDERRNVAVEKEVKPDPMARAAIPTGPRGQAPQRNIGYFNSGPRPTRKPPINLPAGWKVSTDQNGYYYFYDVNNRTQWQRPTQPAVLEPKMSDKAKLETKSIQDIIDSLTKEPPRRSASATPQQAPTPVPEPKREKWRSLPMEKQMKIYENTLFPHVKYVMDKFRDKLPKEDLKKFAREVNKKLVASDYKNKRVTDPTSIAEKQQKKVRKYVKDFFDRAVQKYHDHEKRKTDRAATEPTVAEPSSSASDALLRDNGVAMSDIEDEQAATPRSSPELKRKREGDIGESPFETPSEAPSVKRLKEDENPSGEMAPVPSPPPPPPPPPEERGSMLGDGDGDASTPTLTEEERFMREEEEALMRENEEAQRLEDEAEMSKQQLREPEAGETGVNGIKPAHVNGKVHAPTS